MTEQRNAPEEQRTTTDRRKMLWCKHCKQEFLTYRLTGESKCPDCQSPCDTVPPRSAHVGDADMSEKRFSGRGGKVIKILLALAVLGALAFGGWKAYEDPELVGNFLDRFKSPSGNTPDANAPDGNAPAGNEPPAVAPDSLDAPAADTTL